MATRRTRIKGIANIPQRRKPTNTAPNEDSLLQENEEKIPDEPNLKLQEEENTEVKSAVVRRKFIKPTISVNSIIRKAKESEEGKTEGQVSAGENNKIIILNEVIAYSDQSEPVVIYNQSPGDKGQKLEEGPPGNTEHVANALEVDIPKPPQSPQIQQIQPIDVEYPIPPPSPNKLNRSRIKAIPRLGQRNISFSASESEDESRRNYRHRNDSVCSSTSGAPDTSSIADCPSPQKPREFNSVIQRKCRRTEQSRKLAEARREFYLKFGDKKPDRQKLTMIDLIFYNPVTNPMNSENKKEQKVTTEEEEKIDEPDPKSEEESENLAPQIKIGPDGEIIIDEKSLVVENKAVKKNREQIEKSEAVNGNFDTGYGVYKRAKRSKDWSKQETLKFYKALNTLGTDFTLMCELFPRRTRRELKQKFKKEERVNRSLIDKAIMQPCGFAFDDFMHEVNMEEKELLELEKMKEKEKEMKVEMKKRKTDKPSKKRPAEKSPTMEPKRRKKALDIFDVIDDNSDVSDADDENDEITYKHENPKPTRSGRIPKSRLNQVAPETTKPNEPGSFIIQASTGANGQPVYKVCMITEENKRQQISSDVTTFEEALKCKDNGIASLFTITATTTESLLEEKNVTINEEENCHLTEQEAVVI